NRISVYSADPALLQAVEAARTRRGQPETASVPYRAPAYAAPVHAPALTNETCEFVDCAASGVPYPYPGAFVRRHPHNLVQAVLPPGAIAGTINSNGAIPGNTAGTNSVPAETFRAGPRMKPLQSRQFPDPQRRSPTAETISRSHRDAGDEKSGCGRLKIDCNGVAAAYHDRDALTSLRPVATRKQRG